MKIKNILLCLIVFFCAYVISSNLIPKFYYSKAQFALKNKDYQTASNYLYKALLLRPNNLDYRYYYVKSLTKLKPTYKIQKIIYKFSNGEDSAASIAQDKINDWKRNINLNIGNNYIDQVPMDSAIIRWNKNSFPLRVYIDEQNFLSVPEYYKDAILKAFNQWDKSIDFIGFKYISNRSDAQIEILLKELPDNICDKNGLCKYVVGYTEPDVRGNTLNKMTITLYDKTPNGDYFSDKEVYNTVLHEIGHALGIMGHSYSTDDLMYMQAQNSTNIFIQYKEDFHYISGNDINTMKLLYMLKPDITDNSEPEKLIYPPIILGSKEDIAKKKFKEAISYIKSSPDISVGYINLAGAYTDLKQYKKALTALEKALDKSNTDNERFVIYYNFAYIYRDLKQYKAALDYANLAKNIQSSQDILELISIIEHEMSVN